MERRGEELTYNAEHLDFAPKRKEAKERGRGNGENHLRIDLARRNLDDQMSPEDGGQKGLMNGFCGRGVSVASKKLPPRSLMTL